MQSRDQLIAFEMKKPWRWDQPVVLLKMSRALVLIEVCVVDSLVPVDRVVLLGIGNWC